MHDYVVALRAPRLLKNPYICLRIAIFYRNIAIFYRYIALKRVENVIDFLYLCVLK